jgi:hypothetical protein
MNKKALIIGGAVLAALVPAGAGLAANPSLSSKVPLNAIQVDATTTSSPSATGTAGPTSIPTIDDHGGDRPRGAGDDSPTHSSTHRSTPRSSATHEAGDDKGGLRAPGVSDDSPTHDAGDDKGGQSGKSGKSGGGGDDSSGRGSGHGGGSDDSSDDSSGHGSDD